MQIFYGEKDIDYNNPNGYAFLNWRFDDSMGGNNKENPFQGISDNFEMGKAYADCQPKRPPVPYLAASL